MRRSRASGTSPRRVKSGVSTRSQDPLGTVGRGAGTSFAGAAGAGAPGVGATVAGAPGAVAFDAVAPAAPRTSVAAKARPAAQRAVERTTLTGSPDKDVRVMDDS